MVISTNHTMFEKECVDIVFDSKIFRNKIFRDEIFTDLIFKNGMDKLLNVMIRNKIIRMSF